GGSDARRELVRVSGPPFDTVVSAASGNPQEARDLALTNGTALVSWLDRLLAELDRWREAIAESRRDVLEQQFAEAAAMRTRWDDERNAQARGKDSAP
ncbi:MAG TPA: prephenate dehydrogenase dimerization domain-containing protein, partial [Chloroflexota bacterium]